MAQKQTIVLRGFLSITVTWENETPIPKVLRTSFVNVPFVYVSNPMRDNTNNDTRKKSNGQAENELECGIRCNRCHQPGHWNSDCQLRGNYGMGEIKRTTGIPRSFLKPANMDTPGAKINPQGKISETP